MKEIPIDNENDLQIKLISTFGPNECLNHANIVRLGTRAQITLIKEQNLK